MPPTHKTKPIENTAVLVATNIDREKERNLEEKKW